MHTLFDALSTNPDVRAIVLSSSNPRAYTSGLDLVSAASSLSGDTSTAADPARRAVEMRRYLTRFQAAISSLEACEKPVITALNGICFGLAIDIASAADVRVASADARMSIKEVDVGLAADIGTLQRLPRAVGASGWISELALTGREFGAEEAARVGFVNRVLPDWAAAVDTALQLATLIAEKSPVAVTGTKALLKYSQEHTVAEGLEYTRAWNAAALQTDDLMAAVGATMQRKKPTFEKL